MKSCSDKGWVSKASVFLISQTLSLFGSSVVQYVILWYITLQTSSGIMMTLATVCSFLPQVLVSLFAGVWADRYSRKKLIIYSDLFTGATTLVLAVLFALGDKSIPLLFAALALRSVGTGIQTPAVGAILPQIVPVEKLTRVNGVNNTLNSIMLLMSPAVGGLLLSAVDFAYALLFDVVTAAAAVTVMSFLKVKAISRAEENTTALQDLKQGVAYAKNHKLIRSMLSFYAIFFILIAPAAFLTPVMVERSFGPEVWRLSANEMVWTFGSLVGGILISVWGGFKNRIYTMAVSALAFGITFSLLGVAGSFTAYLIIMFISGIFMPVFGTAETVLIQEHVEESMLGRVFSIIQIIASSAMPFGMVLFGPLADVVKIEFILIGSGLLIIVLSLYIFFNKPLLALDAPVKSE